MTPLFQITFKGMESFEMAENWIRKEADKLETFYSPIMACHVTVEIPHRHHKKGTPYHIRIHLTLPGGAIIVKREPTLGTKLRQLGEAESTKRVELDTAHKNLRQAIQDAFNAAARRLRDYAQRQAGRVKIHESLAQGRVSRLLPEEGHGFLVTPDGREIYFHRNSVLNRAFPRMAIGTRVAFSEERGEKGPQASTVRIIERRSIRRGPQLAAVSAD
jgi:cold shock CspA family protein